MKPFAEIYHRAAQRKGGDAQLNKLMQVDIKTPKQLAAISDDRWLSAMTNGIFKAGFVWKVIDNKWDGFEQAFWKFNVIRCAYMSEEDVDALAKDTRIVRNRQKILTVRENAVFLLDIQQEHGSFGKLAANWPESDFVGLLQLLQKRGSRLGGMTAQYFLRRMGKAGFVLSRDGTAALIDASVIDKAPSGRAAMQKVQDAYNAWAEESGLNLAQISRVLGMSIDAV